MDKLLVGGTVFHKHSQFLVLFLALLVILLQILLHELCCEQIFKDRKLWYFI